MGFISAVKALGELDKQHALSPNPDWEKIDSYLELPLPIDKPVKVIRIWLKIGEIASRPVEVSGVTRTDLADYMPGGASDKEQQRRYLYRKPVGANTTWSFSPIQKLGKPKTGKIKKLLGTDDDWAHDQESFFFKIKYRILDDYEKTGFWTVGSVNRVMNDLKTHAGDIADLWSDKNQSYLLIFGIDDNGTFLYPGEVSLFKEYFISKMNEKVVAKKSFISDIKCSLCGRSGASLNLNAIFKFSTFDKPNFLPGTRKGKEIETKIFPVCSDCFGSLSRGKAILDRSFLDTKTINKIKIYIVPELISGIDYLNSVSEYTKDFIHNGIETEESLFRSLLRHDESIVLHFLFWEQNQAQDRLHLMIEDVPPSHLKNLESLWNKSYDIHLEKNTNSNHSLITSHEITLDSAIKTIYSTFVSLSDKNEQDEKWMRSFVLDILGRLLSNQSINIKTIKSLMVSRFPRLFSDPKWLRFAGRNLREMAAILDFLTRSSRR